MEVFDEKDSCGSGRNDSFPSAACRLYFLSRLCQRKGGRNRKVRYENTRIAVIPGDGIGKEVVPEGMRVLEAAGRKFRYRIQVGRTPVEL